ncbi:unnamed protein product [Leptosia nina]|uniref:Uncharacterized protein n=1 Tax=Leptosia nina TaxID=320188 RepID=A0AAV1JKT8_9NEOP
MGVLNSKGVLLLLFLCLASAIQLQKQNQTSHDKAINSQEHFIEDAVKIKTKSKHRNENVDKTNINAVADTYKPSTNETKKDPSKKDTVVSKSSTPNKTLRNTSKAIKIPLDLLLTPRESLKPVKISANNFTKINHEDVSRKQQPKNLKEQKNKFNEDSVEAEDGDVSDFIKKISTKSRNKSHEHSDSIIDDVIDLKISHNDYNKTENDCKSSLPKILNEKNIIKSFPPNNETVKKDTPPKSIEIFLNHDVANSDKISQPSTIVIHNSSYQEISQPIVSNYQYVNRYPYCPYSYYHRPYHWSYNPYKRHYSYECYNNPYTYTPFYYPKERPQVLWKSWNTMDITINNVKSIRLNCAKESENVGKENNQDDTVQD